jgi:hypothetical protein
MKLTVTAIAFAICLVGFVASVGLSLETSGLNLWTVISWINCAGMMLNGKWMLEALFPLKAVRVRK